MSRVCVSEHTARRAVRGEPCVREAVNRLSAWSLGSCAQVKAGAKRDTPGAMRDARVCGSTGWGAADMGDTSGAAV